MIIKQTFSCYSAIFLQGIKSKVEKVVQNHTFTHQPATFRCHFYFLAQLSRNRTHIIDSERSERHIYATLKNQSFEDLSRQDVRRS